MQAVVFDEPYRFVPPVYSNFWPAVLQWYLPRYLRKKFGIVSVECRGAEKFRAALQAGQSVLLTPNHCRESDPLVLGYLSREVGRNFLAMASWHLFKQSWFTTFMIRRMGAFSVYREGMDRTAINTAVESLEKGERPLVIFPEGAVSRHNDELMALLDGTALIARLAAKKRAQQGKQVVVLPIAIRYFFRGDVTQAIEPILKKIEHRLSWHPQQHVPLARRISRVAEALLSLKEIEYFGAARSGSIFQRVRNLIDQLLAPLETEYRTNGHDADGVVERVKRIRSAIVPELVSGSLEAAQREHRWRQLADCYLAQQLSMYPEDYIRPGENLPEHVLETVERFEEDLTDEVSPIGPLHVVVQVGEAIPVAPERPSKNEPDPVMSGIETQLQTMLHQLASESPKQIF